ncbi:hypothetical protein [Teredinibacter haidensis]|uniref:hypothetical protein n=1 Tax=Teredinibacter haidensis TaxID=2731755 RepID=UPI000948EE6D|nr:hypothetical protein [Teredinibacter haidensis]
MLKQLKNKHLILAMFIAPILAIIAYVAVDYRLSETPTAAVAGDSYKLAAKSNCRYKSGVCTLHNADIKLTLSAERKSATEVVLSIAANLPVQKILIAVYDGSGDAPPTDMQPLSADWTGWTKTVRIEEPQSSSLRLVVNIDGATYFAETSAVFVDFETGFSRDNFSNDTN